MDNFTTHEEFAILRQYCNTIKKIHLRDLFAQNQQRFEDFSLETQDILLDYSKNHVSKEIINQLCQLADKVALDHHIEKLFTAGIVNFTENRAALHTALRNRSAEPVYYGNENVMPTVMASQIKMRTICDQLRSGKWLGHTDKAIKDIVNIGIGGSDLGVAMTCEALHPYVSEQLNFHFVSNVDASHLQDVLATLSPATTLFIVSSKSFNTVDTLLNAATAKAWLGNNTAIKKQMLAVTANKLQALDFGIAAENILEIQNWVGGRFSIWSAMGLALAIAIGMDHFENFLTGAWDMDKHFRSAPFAKNMPVILALLGIWYGNFFKAQTQAILPYAHHLRHLPFYLQQLHMESNGKQVNRDGLYLDHLTAPVLWGQVGSNGQHAFHQLLHQSQHLIPVDFILAINSHSEYDDHHKQLVASCFSQSQALMCGNDRPQIIRQLQLKGYDKATAIKLAAHKTMPGNKPSNTLLIKQLTPRSLGALIALYEHKVFVQSILWGINAFDQFGVEVGKTTSIDILAALDSKCETANADNLSDGLIRYFQRHFNLKTAVKQPATVKRKS